MLQQEIEKALNVWVDYYDKEQEFIDAIEQDSKPAGYGEFLLFSLDEFDGKIWSKALFKKLKPIPEPNDKAYFINNKGLPVKEVDKGNEWHKGSTIYIKYEQIRTIEISYVFGNKYPDILRIIQWENGLKVSYCSLSINGGTNDLNKYENPLLAFHHLINNRDSFSWISEYFSYDQNGKTNNIKCYRNQPGIGPMEGYKSFVYEGNILQKIVAHWEGLPPHIEYLKKLPGFKVSKFLKDLSNLFYEAICKALKDLNEESPIALMDVSYQNQISYWPYIIYATESQLAELGPPEPYGIFYTILWSEKTFEIETCQELNEHYAILEGLVEKDYTKHYGEKMWQLFAKKLNGEKDKHPSLSKDFFVFTHGDLYGLEEADLRKNGATKQQIRHWKKEGHI